MDISPTPATPVFRESRFRTPGPSEQACGLWVDRIGAGVTTRSPHRSLRVLGQFATVTVDVGEGWFFSPQSGKQAVHVGDVMVLYPDCPTRYGPFKQWNTRWIVWNGPEANMLKKLGYLPRGVPIVRRGNAAVDQAHSLL